MKKVIFLLNKKSSYHRTHFLSGGVSETRTRARLATSTSLAGKPLHQLGYYSTNELFYTNKIVSILQYKLLEHPDGFEPSIIELQSIALPDLAMGAPLDYYTYFYNLNQ